MRVILEKDPYQLPGANRKSRDQLLSAGIDVFSSRDAFAFVHAKFAVTDRKDYVFSTGNYTKTTFAKNREFFVFGSDPGSAAFLRSVFVADFRGSPFVGPVPDRFYLAPVDARSKILSLVRNAKKSVTVFAPSVSDEEFVNALRTAASEGKKVRVCLLKDASDKDVSIFGPGVDVVRTRRAQLHAKTVLTDGKLLLIGSANFTENSLNRNRETGALFSGERLISNYENTLSDDCKW